jgi:hypothetical protein
MKRSFDGALSNFGALNCVPDLHATAQDLAAILRPGAYAAMCLMPRFCWSETLRGIWRLDFKHAFRRWSGATVWRGLPIYYPTSRSVRRAFAPHFHFVRSVSIGRGDHRLFVFRRRALC